MKKWIMAGLLTMCMLTVASLPTCVVESGDQQNITVEGITQNIEVPEDALPDNDELFAGYVEQEMYDTGAALFNLDTGSRLSGADKKIYDILKRKITEVADGERDTAVFTVSLKEVFGIDSSKKFTAEELGVNAIVEDGQITSEAKTALLSKISFDKNSIFKCLLADCPYELYWFDKTKGFRISSIQMSGNSTYFWFTDNELTFRFFVAGDYAIEGETETVNVDTTVTGATKKSAENAKIIVTHHADESDYEKLVSYRTEICNLASYNYNAASDSTVLYGNPWQLIWVFDDDPDTKVVCEGYAKAFQYLCDLSEFQEEDITCWTVTGNMTSGSSSGGHMWNIMTMDDGNNYLVDVTNCDTGAIGADDKLFLAIPSSGSVNSVYRFLNDSLLYQYDEDTVSVNDNTILKLSNIAYKPCQHTGETETRNAKDATCGEDGYTGDKCCKFCGAKLKEGNSISATGSHTWDGGTITIPATCTSKGEKTYHCTVCNATKTEEVATDSNNHVKTELRNAISATCESEGYSGDTYCLSCETKTADGTTIGSLGHSYEDPVFIWSTDGKTCTVKFICSNDANHTVTDNAEVTSSVKTAATCSVKGTTTYTARYEEYTATKEVRDVEIGSSNHTWNSGTVTATPTATKAGVKTYTCTVCHTTKSETIPALGAPAKGKIITDTKGKATYKVTKSGLKNGTVEYTKCTNAKAATVAIPATVKIDGITYKVTSIAKNAFKGNKKITKVTIGKSIKTIGKNAFYGAAKLKTVTISTSFLTGSGIGANAFAKIHAKAVVKVPKKKLASYRKILKKKGVSGKKQTIKQG